MSDIKVYVDDLSEPEFRILTRHVLARMIRSQGRRNFRIKPTSIASLAVGETRTFPIKPGSSPLGNRVNVARRQLSEPNAKWSYRTTNHGLRVTRIA